MLLQKAAERSSLSNREIGRRMGYKSDRAADKAVYKLLNETQNPSFLSVAKFCYALHIGFEDLLRMHDSQ